MKKTIYSLIFALIFIAGCTSIKQKDISIQKGAGEQKQEVILAEAERPRTRAQRILPERYNPGENLQVVVNVQPLAGTTGVIVEEMIPEGWSIAGSTPNFIRQEGNSYKWLVFDREVGEFNITYEVTVPEDAAGRKEFRGAVITHREKTLPTEGDTLIASF